ncbi:hypothetical protein FWK35_00039208 [Aphis craccivora]|uniref:Uncharacterized protein n=1 Tax=Aphis craccivora TaxID=307492 RepID=A0A6G0Y5R6_APHCR|nr:hypothetical protein FWK35_00039208 [Aphis craccivora]
MTTKLNYKNVINIVTTKQAFRKF